MNTQTGFSLLIGSFQAASTLLPGLLMSMVGVWVEAGYSERNAFQIPEDDELCQPQVNK